MFGLTYVGLVGIFPCSLCRVIVMVTVGGPGVAGFLQPTVLGRL